MKRLFCYGTLKRGQRAHDLLIKSGAEYIADAMTAPNYQLYDVGRFPGMTPGNSAVHGELYHIPETSLPLIDQYEGVSFGLFYRRTIELSDGTKALAYFFDESLDKAVLIESGSWPN